MKIGIITGASSGLGKSFYENMNTFFPEIDQIWLIARRSEYLKKSTKNETNKSKCISIDITSKEELEIFENYLRDESPDVKILINAAGCGTNGPFFMTPLEEQLRMVDLNCKALLTLTYLVKPYMHENARIIQVSSAASFMPQPYFATYAASKAFVERLSLALSFELKKEKIYITTLCPGPIRTPFIDNANKYYIANHKKEKFYVEANQVAIHGLKAAKKKKRRAIYGFSMKVLFILTKIVPQKILMRFV